MPAFSITLTEKFKKDLKKLKKRFRTLDSDLDNFINTQIKLYHELEIDNKGIVRISDVGFENPQIYKALKFACKSLKGTGSKSGIRLIYAYSPDERKIEFIEIYFKGDKENEDKNRIRNYDGK